MENELFTLATIPEIATCWNVHQTTVRRALYSKRNPLTARRTGRVILITTSSARKRWGDPIYPPQLTLI
jgi:hypothetical protein